MVHQDIKSLLRLLSVDRKHDSLEKCMPSLQQVLRGLVWKREIIIWKLQLNLQNRGPFGKVRG